jgi:hypothetical protein
MCKRDRRGTITRVVVVIPGVNIGSAEGLTLQNYPRRSWNGAKKRKLVGPTMPDLRG